MFKKILVPLDDSQLAEQVLPFALRLASLGSAHLILLHVTELPLLLDDYAQDELKMVNKATLYLETLKQKLTDHGVAGLHLEPDQLEVLISYGNPSHEILRVANDLNVDLIVMSTYGRSGIVQLVHGSVTRHVLQHSLLPVVLVRPSKAVQPQPDVEQKAMMNEPLSIGRDLRPVVVALDGSKELEQAIAPALEIAKQLNAPIKLLNVAAPIVPTHSGETGLDYIYKLYDAETTARCLNNQISQYLAGLQKEFLAKNVDCNSVIRVGDPVDEIVAYALEVEARVVVMVSHSRDKTNPSNNVAEQVMRQTYLPVMMIYPTAQQIKNVANTISAVN